jgi:CheY-like chemotaxis protein
LRLAQVFANLLDNAAKYTEPGGAITVTAERCGAEVAVTVTDTGIGIAPEHVPDLFEMFAQIGSDPDRSQGGLGIGLALTRHLVELHGGRIEVRSAGRGQGSAFVVRLPISAETPADRLAPSAPRRDFRDKARHILVADDNPDCAESLAVLLRLLGHEVEIAGDGLEAVAAAERYRPETVLLDLGMPKLDGYGACRRIRERPWGKEIAIFALTGWAQESDRSKSREAGFDGHLVKPVGLTDLLQALEASRCE